MSDIRELPIHVPFRESLMTARGPIEERRGFLLSTEINDQKIVSEITLMPDFGTEYFEHAERVLEGETMMTPSAPATLFGLDCLRYAWEERTREPVEIPIAFLLPSDNPAGLKAVALQAHHQGYQAFKLKVGFRTPDEDAKLFRALCDTIPATFRLDANLGWSETELREFLTHSDCSRIEWFEDPTSASLTTWEQIGRDFRVPIACDEALDRKKLDNAESWSGFQTLIVKPSRIGTVSEIEALCNKAREMGKQISFSSLFESSVGMTYLGHLARQFGTEGMAHGFGTLRFLKEDTLRSSLTTHQGSLSVPSLTALPAHLSDFYAEKLWP